MRPHCMSIVSLCMFICQYICWCPFWLLRFSITSSFVRWLKEQQLGFNATNSVAGQLCVSSLNFQLTCFIVCQLLFHRIREVKVCFWYIGFDYYDKYHIPVNPCGYIRFYQPLTLCCIWSAWNLIMFIFDTSHMLVPT